MKIKVLESFEELIGKEIVYTYEQEYGKNVIYTKDNCILIFESQEDEILIMEKRYLKRFLTENKKYIVDDMIKKNVIKTEDAQPIIDEYKKRQDSLQKKAEQREFEEYKRLKVKFENS